MVCWQVRAIWLKRTYSLTVMAYSRNSRTVLARLKEHARGLKAETFALYLASRHPKTPWYAKLLVTCIVAYALSPIDLIPDFVPILGYLDDLILLPMGIAMAIKMIPEPRVDGVPNTSSRTHLGRQIS
jgi:uncharacterized membrane protein YkvA (DUF1232 family)